MAYDNKIRTSIYVANGKEIIKSLIIIPSLFTTEIRSAFHHTYMKVNRTSACVAKARMCHYFVNYIVCFMLTYYYYLNN